MEKIKTHHRFVDEAGDTTFYLKGRGNAIGVEGVSNCFILGMVKFSEPLDGVRKKVIELQNQIATNPFYKVKSVLKKINNSGYYLHATDDIPEIRKMMFDLMLTLDCSFEAIVGSKSIARFETRHKGKQEYFYADMLSHLLKNKFSKHEKMVMNISDRNTSTKHHNLQLALGKAKQRFSENNKGKEIKTDIVFNVAYPTQEPLLNVADYFCWAVQRVFEKGETRFYDYLMEKISLVVDLYDARHSRSNKWGNYYNKNNPLTDKNKISPLLH